jgi:hypothetical protein
VLAILPHVQRAALMHAQEARQRLALLHAFGGGTAGVVKARRMTWSCYSRSASCADVAGGNVMIFLLLHTMACVSLRGSVNEAQMSAALQICAQPVSCKPTNKRVSTSEHRNKHFRASKCIPQNPPPAA